MAAEEDSDDKTRVGTALPPKLPSGRQPTKTSGEEESDSTQVAGAPPPMPKLQPPAVEPTGVAAVPPPPPKPLPPAAAAPSQPAAAELPAPSRISSELGKPAPTPVQAGPVPAPPSRLSATVEEQDDATVIIRDRPHVTVRLQRLLPPGRSEMIGLDRSSYVLGRAHTCDIRLYSPAAGREHARLTNRDGTWHVEPLGSHVVVVNGAKAHEEVAATHKMRLQFGGDELLFLDDHAALQAVQLPAPRAPSKFRIAVIVMVIAALAAAAIWLFT